MTDGQQRYECVIRIASHTLHLLAHDGVCVRERVVRPPVGALARFGDPTPIRVDPASRTPADLVTDVLADVAGGPLTSGRVLALVPDHWGPHRHDLLAQLLTELGAEVDIRSETAFTLNHKQPAVSAEDEAIWVRTGSETTIAAIVRRGNERWVFSHRIETPWGGDSIDDDLVQFVMNRLPGTCVPEDLRTSCRDAREKLSRHVSAGITSGSSGVRLHRRDVEELTEPEARAALEATLMVVLAQLDHPAPTILLSGGVGRTPLVAQLTSELSGQPVQLVDWRDAVDPLLLAPTVERVSRSEESEQPVAITVNKPQARRELPLSRSKVYALGAAALILISFAVAAALQPGTAGGLMQALIGTNGPAAKSGPGAHAATRTFSHTLNGAEASGSGEGMAAPNFADAIPGLAEITGDSAERTAAAPKPEATPSATPSLSADAATPESAPLAPEAPGPPDAPPPAPPAAPAPTAPAPVVTPPTSVRPTSVRPTSVRPTSVPPPPATESPVTPGAAPISEQPTSGAGASDSSGAAGGEQLNDREMSTE